MEKKVHFSELGLSNTRAMFKNAVNGGYAIPAYNFNNLEQLQAIVTACAETNSPVIIQVSKGARDYANATMLRFMAMGAVQMAREMGSNIPICLHLDHGDSFEICQSCIDSGFSSVMIDGSHLPYDENVALTRKVVDYARQYDVSVEGELGVLAGIEDEVSAEHSTYTQPDEVEDFVKKTGVDSLAISIGTSHGAYKFKLKEGESVPPPALRYPRRVSETPPRLPDCAARRLQCRPGIRAADQSVRRQDGWCRRRPGRAVAAGRRQRCLQDQHRFRWPPRCYCQSAGISRQKSGRIRSA